MVSCDRECGSANDNWFWFLSFFCYITIAKLMPINWSETIMKYAFQYVECHTSNHFTALSLILSLTLISCLKYDDGDGGKLAVSCFSVTNVQARPLINEKAVAVK